jgi:hypothetical protein
MNIQSKVEEVLPMAWWVQDTLKTTYRCSNQAFVNRNKEYRLDIKTGDQEGMHYLPHWISANGSKNKQQTNNIH